MTPTYRPAQSRRTAPAGRFWRGNLHTHSTRSDGRLAPEAVAAFYRDAGYHFVAITDHFRQRYGYPITDTRPLRSASFTTLLGAEIHAPLTARGHDWHVVALGLPTDYAHWTEGESIQSMCRRAAAAGAFLGIAHPQWYGLTLQDALSIPEAHAVEIYNHGCAVDCDRGDGFVLLEEMLAQGRRIGAYAADDAHFHTPDAGGAWVMVRAEALEPELLLDALKRGDYYSSQGPDIHEIEITRSEALVRCSPVASVNVVGSGMGSQVMHGEALTSVTLPLEPLGDSPYLRITVSDAKGHRAWSNPIWR